MKRLKTPFTKEDLQDLKIGEIVYISGTIYAARDAVHKELVKLLDEGGELPMDIRGGLIYYVGPSPAREGDVIGSCGPTTSYRMDPYTPRMLDQGLMAMIGKGRRDDSVKEKMLEKGAVYFTAVGGAAALIKSTVKEVEVIAYDYLGPEALRRLVVEDFPATVTIDAKGRDLYLEGREEYLKGHDK